MSHNVEKSLLDIDFASLTRGPFTPSPAAWEDQVLYFLMLDRFSDGNENGGYADTPRRLGDRMRSLVCWSRMFMDQETLVVFNSDESERVCAWSTVAPLLRADGDQFHLIFWHAPRTAAPPAAKLTVRVR